MGNKVEGAEKVKKFTSAEARKAKKDRIARRKRGEGVVSPRFDCTGRTHARPFSSQMKTSEQAFAFASLRAPPSCTSSYVRSSVPAAVHALLQCHQ
jgi:hypothetical protein